MLLVWKGSLGILYLPGFMLHDKDLNTAVPRLGNYKEIIKSTWTKDSVSV